MYHTTWLRFDALHSYSPTYTQVILEMVLGSGFRTVQFKFYGPKITCANLWAHGSAWCLKLLWFVAWTDQRRKSLLFGFFLCWYITFARTHQFKSTNESMRLDCSCQLWQSEAKHGSTLNQRRQLLAGQFCNGFAEFLACESLSGPTCVSVSQSLACMHEK